MYRVGFDFGHATAAHVRSRTGLRRLMPKNVGAQLGAPRLELSSRGLPIKDKRAVFESSPGTNTDSQDMPHRPAHHDKPADPAGFLFQCPPEHPIAAQPSWGSHLEAPFRGEPGPPGEGRHGRRQGLQVSRPNPRSRPTSSRPRCDHVNSACGEEKRLRQRHHLLQPFGLNAG